MFAVVAASWALFLGIGMMMLGNGLQASLIGIRATGEGFPTAVTGLVMSCYFFGFLAGSVLTPRIISTVGHIRVFSALASLASVAAVVHSVFVDPYTWGAMRFVTGFSYAGLYVVAESWLNDRATNETRGQLLSVYMVVMLGGVVGGQALLNLADPNGFALFVLASVLVSLALVPISLTAMPAPDFAEPSKISLIQIYRVSPLGVVGAIATGFAHGTLFGMGAVYGNRIGLSVAEISLMMGLTYSGGLLLQWPIGHLSDRFDRRRMISIVTFLAAIFALAAIPLALVSEALVFATLFLFGGMTLPLYSLCIAHTNDHLEPKQMVAASGTMVLLGGIGACFGPIASAGLMALIDADGFLVILGGVHAALGGFALYRMGKRAATPLDEQHHTVPMMSGAVAPTSALSANALRDQMDRDLANMSRSQMNRW